MDQNDTPPAKGPAGGAGGAGGADSIMGPCLSAMIKLMIESGRLMGWVDAIRVASEAGRAASDGEDAAALDEMEVGIAFATSILRECNGMARAYLMRQHGDKVAELRRTMTKEGGINAN